MSASPPPSLLHRLPAALVGFRVACAPIILALAWMGAPGTALFAVLLAAFVSDVFDGILARRLGVATPALRRADSLADTALYAAAGCSLLLIDPGLLARYAWPLGALVGLEIVRAVVERAKFGRVAAYHMWSAKAWGVALLLGFAEVYLTGRAGTGFALALGLGILTDLEGLAASLRLRRWHADVPSLYHAWTLEQANR